MKHSYVIVLTTTDSEEIANRIIKTLLEENLAACIQQYPVKSSYRWEGKIVHDKEILLQIKSKEALVSQIEEKILSLHNYEIPEILTIPVTDGYEAYLKWIDSETKAF